MVQAAQASALTGFALLIVKVAGRGLDVGQAGLTQKEKRRLSNIVFFFYQDKTPRLNGSEPGLFKGMAGWPYVAARFAPNIGPLT